MDLRPELAMFFETFGAPATVTPVGGAPVETTVIVRGPSRLSPSDPRGGAVEQLKEASLKKSEVATLQNRSRIVITDGADAGTYSVDDLVREDAEELVVRIAAVAA